MTEYLSRDSAHLAKLQRKRRERMTRIDYMPGSEALEAIEAVRANRRPGSQAATNSSVLDAIVREWAALTGINKWPKSKPMTPEKRPELIDRYARANDSGGIPAWLMRPASAPARVQCGARTKAGHPCRGKSIPGKRRCKWHGGCSTGPKTAEGKARALANLRQYARS